MEENQMGTDMNFRKVMGGSSIIEPDFRMKSILRNEIKRIVKESQKKNVDTIQMFQTLIATIMSLITEITGSKISLRKALETLRGLDEKPGDSDVTNV
jgi:hypothetical protein